ncbi:MAG: pilus assembly PilX N-terminal domain-containing protein [Patescibacteria group bacterium]
MRQGQAVLIILLVVAVSLGLGISIIAQSTTDVKISEHEQESARAFNAAEAGIEEALKNISTIAIGVPQTLQIDGLDQDVSFEVNGENFLETTVAENESAQVILGGVNTLTINWVKSGNPVENLGTCVGASGQTRAALLITIIKSNYQLRRIGVNPCAGLIGYNNIALLVTTTGDDDFARKYSFPVQADDVLLRIRPLYNQATIRVTGANELPAQTYVINSSAQADTLESKAIEVSRAEPATPSIFDYVLFSGTSIIK